MSTSEEAAAEVLSKTALRDFGPPIPHDERDYSLPSYRATLPPQEAPIPVLLCHALTLIGITHSGPGEKVAWWTDFTYKGYPCELAHEKFGLRLRVGGDLTEEQADRLLAEMRKKLISAVNTVEGLLAERANGILNAGNVTVVNQHRQLRGTYTYFRERATHPDVVEDVVESVEHEGLTGQLFTSGRNVMAMNSFRDLVAAISAYVSWVEHVLVLALPFAGFDPATDNLVKIIGDRWGDKWRRVVGHSDAEAVRLRERLAEVVERWRNTYSHGGFEKGNGATIYLHTPGLGALPVGLSNIRESPLMAFHAASERDIEGVFALLDEIDAWLTNNAPNAMEWIESGLAVRFDAKFMAQVAECTKSEDGLASMINAFAYEQDMITNMDY
ncbi:hypothetical protein [Allobranchiibius huperziae]|uniref:Uncharacterized protein n=1 Tax=Allobranchiibius huperziae TaxID=1874116 RepID=A0A853DIA2_9MICO|nr:hypothetical protein [Allobranchiibius huperziae]NYJ76498.1 hypothetical protein [Allobranchiibius huperziae]